MHVKCPVGFKNMPVSKICRLFLFSTVLSEFSLSCGQTWWESKPALDFVAQQLIAPKNHKKRQILAAFSSKKRRFSLFLAVLGEFSLS